MRKMMMSWVVLMLGLAGGPLVAAEVELSAGQSLYVPVYSHVYLGPKQQSYNLAVNLSIRNTDSRQAITVSAIDYLADNGRLVKRFAVRPVRIAPLGSYRVFIPEADRTAGFGAKFIVRWQAAKPVNLPIVESVMIGARAGQGISFSTRGQPLRD
jgi:hypothetical protein